MKRILFIGIIFMLSIPAMCQNLDKEAALEEKMSWFSEAKFGIFIHWGIYSRGDWSESWSFHNKQVTMDEYYSQEKDFTACNYDPRFWAKLIKESGAAYTVITSKHHDGFALWDTKAGNISAVKTSSAARDVLTPFVKAIRKEGGIKLGIYYSLIDWSRDDYPNVYREGPPRYDINKEPAIWQHFLDFNRAQLDELQEAYTPDLYWFDGDWEFSSEQWNAPEIVGRLRKANPKVIINSRIQGNGDYDTPELGIPIVRPKAKWWETCMTINDSWGYRKDDNNFKSLQTCLSMFVDCLSKGGNLLLDIGPRSDGTIPQQEVELLKNMGRWIRKHKEAVNKTIAGLPDGHVQARTTLNLKGDVIYVYLPYRPIENIELKGLKNKINRVRVVGSGTELSFKRYNDADWIKVPGVYYIDVPESVLDENVTVLAIELDRPVEIYRGEGQVIEFNE